MMGDNPTGTGVNPALQESLWGGGGGGGATLVHLQNKGHQTKQQCELGAFPPPAVMQIRTVTFELRVKRCNESLQKQMKRRQHDSANRNTWR